jgi:hypothetical protein
VPRRNHPREHPEFLVTPEVPELWQTEGLFSDHYLRVRLGKSEWWPSDAAAQPVWEFCRDLYQRR